MFLLGVLSTFIILFNIEIAGISLFKYVALGFGLYGFFRNNNKLKLNVLRQDYSVYFLSVFLCTFFILFSSSPYKEFSIRSAIDTCFLVFLSISVASTDNNSILSFFSGLKTSCYIQIGWCILQIILWYGVKIDLNKFIFVDSLHLLDNASKYAANGTLCISGLSHHPSNLIVIIILILSLIKGTWKWPICILISIVSQNSTTLIAVILSMIIYAGPGFFKCLKENRIKKSFILLVIFGAFFALILLTFGLDIIISSLGKLIDRINSVYRGLQMDGSTFAHVSYYTFLPKIWNQYNLFEKLFGYSYGWTGGMFYYFLGDEYSHIYKRPLLNWGVESDPMNLFYGLGIIGFLFFYKWIIGLIFRGRRVNPLYSLMILSIVVSGLFYCIQYNYVILIEVALSVAIQRRLDIFFDRSAINK